MMTDSPRPGGAKRIVRIHDEFPLDYAEVQTAYLNGKTGRFYPSTDVYFGDQLYMRVNSLRGKGDEPEAGRPIIGFFGDSVVQCVGPLDSWVQHVRVGERICFNGGVEGSPLGATIDRAIEFSQKIPFECIVIYPGWHNIVYGESTDEYWISQFDRLSGQPRVVHMTLDPDFHQTMVNGPPPVFAGEYTGPSSADDPGFYLEWGGIKYTPEGYREFSERLDHKNNLIRSYCRRTGRPVIDMEVVRPTKMEERGRRHFDLIHLRPKAFPVIGAYLSRQLQQILEGETARAGPDT